MPFTKSIRAKVVLSALIPGTLMLVMVAILGLYAYERVARGVVKQRDTELARVSAARLSEGLARYIRLLQSTAADEDVRSIDPDRLATALEQARGRLVVFDAGVLAYNNEGRAVWSVPCGEDRRGTSFPIPAEFDKVWTSRQPSFSDIIQDEVTGEDVIIVTVPVVGSGTDINGILAGMATVKRSLMGATYTKILELKPGRSGFAYLVDGNGRSIYHRQSTQLARDLSSSEAVKRVMEGETDAVITQDPDGEIVVSAFAPVPGTGWGVITQERWDNVAGAIRGYGQLTLGLLVAGGVLSIP